MSMRVTNIKNKSLLILIVFFITAQAVNSITWTRDLNQNSSTTVYQSIGSLWNITGSNVYLNNSAYNVGIGTSSPSQKLSVIGNTTTTGYFRSGNTSLGSANGDLAVGHLGKYQLFYQASTGDLQMYDSTGTNDAQLRPDTSYWFNTDYDANGDFIVSGDTDPSLFVVDVGLDKIGIGTAIPTEELEVNGDAKATRIGVNVAPTYDLTVNGSTGIIGNSDEVQLTVKAKSGTAQTSDMVEMYNRLGQDVYTMSQSGAILMASSGSGGDAPGSVGFYEVRTHFPSSLRTDSVYSNTGTTNNTGQGFKFRTKNHDGTSDITAQVGMKTIDNVNRQAQLYFAVMNNGGTVTPLYIDGDDGIIFDQFNVGIGTSTPSEELEVNGDTKISGDLGIGNGVSMVRELNIKDTVRLEPRSSAPSSPSLGDLYVDSDTNELCFYNSTVWVGLATGGACA